MIFLCRQCYPQHKPGEKREFCVIKRFCLYQLNTSLDILSSSLFLPTY